MEIRAYRVSKIVEYMRDLVEDDMLLCSLWVQGEVSNFVEHSSGHLFFSLKDEEAALKCVIFKAEASELPFSPQNGDLVRLYGRVSLYKKSGDLRFIGEFMDRSGKGNIHQDLEKLKAKLLEEGLFENSRPMPKYPEKIAIVTSPTGAVIADMLKVIRGLNPLVRVVLVPVLVQGYGAPESIAGGLEIAGRESGADVIIVGRGGGSAEDLWGFNHEAVVRAVFNSPVPVVSAVGHQTDFTLCDLAADLRAATPTEAAQLVTPDINDILRLLTSSAHRLNFSLEGKLKSARNQLNMRVNRFNSSVKNCIERTKQALIGRNTVLEKISPMAVLRRGFAVVEDAEGGEIRQGVALKSGQRVVLKFHDTEKKAEIL